MLQSEMIGKVIMNYKHYTGQDLYSDGAVEDELLDIVINHKPEEFGAIIEERASWPVFYHLSELRGNIVEWMPIPVGAKTLWPEKTKKSASSAETFTGMCAID